MQVHLRQERVYTYGHTGKPSMIIGKPMTREIDKKRLQKLLAAGRLPREIAGELGIPRLRRNVLLAMHRALLHPRGA
jgi:hypothetical protein